MPKIYLSPAYHWFNTCAMDGCDETTHNNLYLDELEPFLTACGIAFRRGPRRVPRSSESGTALMMQAVADSNAWGADVHYISHTNASNGTVRGYRPIIYTGSKAGKRLAECMIARRREVYPCKITLNQRTDLYELRSPKATSYYEEHVFHDNRDDAAWFHDNLRKVARAAAKGFCDYFAIPYVEPYDQTEESAQTPSGAPRQSTSDGEAASTVSLHPPILHRGDAGVSVKALQLLLNGCGHSCGLPDGAFGCKTDAAVRRFQQAMSLQTTGAADQAVWSRLLGG